MRGDGKRTPASGKGHSVQASILSFFGTGSNAPPSRPTGPVTAKQPPIRKRSPQDSNSSASEDKEERAVTGTSQAAKRRKTRHASTGGGTLDTSGLDGSAGAGVSDVACAKTDAKPDKPQDSNRQQGSRRRPSRTFSRSDSRLAAADTSAATVQLAAKSASTTAAVTTNTTAAPMATAATTATTVPTGAAAKVTGTSTDTNAKGKRLLPTGGPGDGAVTPRDTKQAFTPSGGGDGAPDTPSPETDREQSPAVRAGGLGCSQATFEGGKLVIDVDVEGCSGCAGATNEDERLGKGSGDGGGGGRTIGGGGRADEEGKMGVSLPNRGRCRSKRGTGKECEELEAEAARDVRGGQRAAKIGGVRAGCSGGVEEGLRVDGSSEGTDQEGADNDENDGDDDNDKDAANGGDSDNPSDSDIKYSHNRDDDCCDGSDKDATVKEVTVKEDRSTRQKGTASGQTATASPQGGEGSRRNRVARPEDKKDVSDEEDCDEAKEGKEEGDNEEQQDEAEEDGDAVEEGGGDHEQDGQEEQDGEEEEEEEEDAMQQNGGISEYELQRLERIKKNQAFMATLGLGAARPVAPLSATSSAQGGAASKSRKRKSKPVSRARERAPAVPVRRSARARGAEAVDYSEDKQAIFAASLPPARKPEPEPEPELEETDFDDSTVLKYLCGQIGGAASGSSGGGGEGSESENSFPCPGSAPAASTEEAAEGARRVASLSMLNPRRPLSASGLSTIYTMHFCRTGAEGGGRGGRSAAPPSLLAAGGKGGVVALFSTQRSQDDEADEKAELEEEEEEDERTLMNFKAHKGWVSAVRFLNGERGGGGGGGGGGAGVAGCRLLSSANDSVVKLWDTSKQHRGSPRLLCTADDLHPTRKGIFSMDSHGTRVATGSKDTTVAIASVTPTGLTFDRVLGDCGGSQAFHEKVVKGVSLRDESTVASCGDDSNVRVSDLRSPSFFGVSHRLDGVHSGPCHSVRWHPRDANLLLTAGLDSTVKLHDLRRLDAPLHVFRGHCPYALPRPRAIHRPEFLPAGRGSFNVITCGERSERLSMYDAANGATISRGVIGDEASALAVGGGDWSRSSSPLIAAALPGGSVALLAPIWGSA